MIGACAAAGVRQRTTVEYQVARIRRGGSNAAGIATEPDIWRGQHAAVKNGRAGVGIRGQHRQYAIADRHAAHAANRPVAQDEVIRFGIDGDGTRRNSARNVDHGIARPKIAEQGVVARHKEVKQACAIIEPVRGQLCIPVVGGGVANPRDVGRVANAGLCDKINDLGRWAVGKRASCAADREIGGAASERAAAVGNNRINASALKRTIDEDGVQAADRETTGHA